MRILKIAFITILMVVSSCKKEEEPLTFKQIDLTEKQKLLVESSNSFGFDIFRTSFGISDDRKNMMLSPLSISMALGMTRNGASGSTLDSMTNTLRLNGLSDEEINNSYFYLLETFTTLDPKVKLSIANSIWYRNTFEVQDDFLITNQRY